MNKIFKSVALLATIACALGQSSPSSDSASPSIVATTKSTTYPTAAPTVAPTMYIPENERCVETTIPPGVKPGSCMEVMCYPESIQVGQEFHITVRFCLQRPRKWHLTFGLLDQVTKKYYGGEGTGIVDTRSQCAEVTFLHTFLADEEVDGTIDLMWKFYTITNHGTPPEYLEDIFPNMLSECGVPQQPDYTTPMVDDCPDTGDMRVWNLPPTGMQDGIEWTDLPLCFTPGEDWTTIVDTHLESVPVADLHCNLLIGTGGDVYLGEADVYVTETNAYLLEANPVTDDWDNLPEDYWTKNTIVFTGEQTALVEPGTNVYLACFLVEAFAVYDDVTGWDYLDREFFLRMEFC
jgi:hypothetical protein